METVLPDDAQGIPGATVEMVTVVPFDGIQAILQPQFVTAAEAQAWMDPTEKVLGISIGGEHHAYPISVLSRHEIVNDVVGGQPVAVTWWPLCFSGIVYAREIDGAVHTFGVSGKLIMNVLVMYDHQTRSLWSQFLGQAIEGPKRGVKLDLVPVTQTAWALWTDNHPDTLILDKQGGYRGDSYHYYYRDGQKGVLGESNEDNRLAPKELVVGVSLDGDTKAYPLEALRSQPTVNDSVGGNEVLVFLEINTETALVYDRRVDAMALTFRLLPGGGARPLLMDDETGSTWMALTGLAIDGPLKGAALNRVVSHLSFWFAWNDWNPATDLFQPSGA